MENQSIWIKQAHDSWMQGNYQKAAECYEQAIAQTPDARENYWYLGLMLLLQGQEEEAHTTWLLGMMDGEPEQIDQWTEELVQVLDSEAIALENRLEKSLAWLVRQHIREIAPTDIANLLHLMKVAIAQETLTEEELRDWGVISLLKNAQPERVEANLLLQVLAKLLDFAPLHEDSAKFAEACLPHLLRNLAFADILLRNAVTIADRYSREISQAIFLAELCLRVDAKPAAEVLIHLTSFYRSAGNYDRALETAQQAYSLCESLPDNLPDKIYANTQIINALLILGGAWNEAGSAIARQESMVKSLFEQSLSKLDQVSALRLLTSTYFFPYFRDDLPANRRLQNQVAHLFEQSVQADAKKQGYNRRLVVTQGSESHTKPLKIGYISHYLKRHSFGWMTRWLIQYHNRDRFNLYGYFMAYQPTNDWLQNWYLKQFEVAHKLGLDSVKIAEQIAEDEIDILVDLDSLTLEGTCHVMALKPAPIQITWLGLDASGIPAIDYYLADSNVLPEEADHYYSEKIWRLPQTYIAVDGFEVEIPSQRRDELEIPSDAVVYYSGQTSYKRHPELVRSQMKIIQAVPNSYFLIKTWPDLEGLRNFFIEIAAAEGVERSRLRFLPMEDSEPTHRANLGIADVVLDTYPYNGATTTLETLWMGIPIVTRVGQQWAARNSYTMMINAGITEGIARTEKEYIEWGIKLGTDPDLRQKIYWKLHQGRQTAPLWNAKQFTRNVETAYEQMWKHYLSSQS